MCWNSTSLAQVKAPLLGQVMTMPRPLTSTGPGAVCPATVRLPLVMLILFRSVMVPDRSKMTVRGPVASSAARSEPAPLSLRLVTRRIVPLRPALVMIPKPLAPGMTGSEVSCAKAEETIRVAAANAPN